MVLISRRTLLAHSLGLCSAISGCSSVLDQSSNSEEKRSPPLHAIVMANKFEEEKSLELIAERDGEIVHWGTYDVPPAESHPEENDLGKALSVDSKRWMGCGKYEISARVETEGEFATLDFRDLERSPPIDSKFQPVELDIEFAPDLMRMTTTKLDDPLLSCEGKNYT